MAKDQRERGGIPAPVAVAWGIAEAPTRGPARALSHEEIVRAAVELADQDGLGAVTMQRVAERLDFTTMSLYRYVATKDELLQLMSDAALDLDAAPGVEHPETLKEWAYAVRELYRLHPWLLQIPRAATSIMMPCSMRQVEVALQLMRGYRLAPHEKLATVLALSSLASSFVAHEQSLAGEEPIAFDGAALEAFGAAVAAADLPELGPLMASGQYVSGTGADEAGMDFEFEFSVDALLRGLQAR